MTSLHARQNLLSPVVGAGLEPGVACGAWFFYHAKTLPPQPPFPAELSFSSLTFSRIAFGLFEIFPRSSCVSSSRSLLFVAWPLAGGALITPVLSFQGPAQLVYQDRRHPGEGLKLPGHSTRGFSLLTALPRGNLHPDWSAQTHRLLKHRGLRVPPSTSPYPITGVLQPRSTYRNGTISRCILPHSGSPGEILTSSPFFLLLD